MRRVPRWTAWVEWQQVRHIGRLIWASANDRVPTECRIYTSSQLSCMYVVWINQKYNRAKSAEIIFTNCKRKHTEGQPPQIPDIRHVTSIKMLGVTVTNHLSVGEHVRDVIGKCAQSLHALKLLRHHSMSDDSLRHVYKAVVLSILLYHRHDGVLPAWPISNVSKHLSDVLSSLACTPPTIPRHLN